MVFSQPHIRNILFVTPMYPSAKNGINGIFVREQAEALLAMGKDIRVAHLQNKVLWPFSLMNRYRGTNPEDRSLRKVPLVRFPVKTLPLAIGTASFAPYWGGGLLARIKSKWPAFQPDIVHAHTIVPGLLAAKPVASAFGCPVVVTVHGADARVWLRRPHTRKLILQICNSGIPIICVSPSLKRDLISSGGNPDNLHVIFNGMALDKVHSGPNPLKSEYRDKILVLGVGNLKETKGFDIFIEAIGQLRKAYPAIKGVIVGSGPDKQRLESLIHRRNLQDHVELVGAKIPSRVMEYMDLCTVFCLPSWSEGFGIVYLEAMAHGKPVVAVEGQGIATIVRDSGSGVLVPPRDSEAVTVAIQNLLQHEDKSKLMGEYGRRMVNEQFSWDHCTKEVLNIYKDVMGVAEHH